MKRAVFGALIAVAGALTVSPAGAQPYGYRPGWDGPPPLTGIEDEEMRRREEWRAHRREFRRQQRELAERRAYEAGRRDAGRVLPYGAPEPRGRYEDDDRSPRDAGRPGGTSPWADRWPGGS